MLFRSNTIIAPFKAKVGCKTQRKRENKNCHSVLFRSYPTRNKKFQRNSKKVQKVKKHHYHFFSSPNKLGNAEKERKLKIKKKKKIVTMSSYPTRNKKFQKNRKKIQKNRKHHYGFYSSQNRMEKAGKE